MWVLTVLVVQGVAIAWIRTQQSVVTYLATGATHASHHAPKAWSEQYKGKFDQGWDKLRSETFARQKKLGVIPANAQLTSRPKELPAWDSLSADEQNLYAHMMEDRNSELKAILLGGGRTREE